MRMLVLAILTTTLSGCASTVSDSALADGLRGPLKNLAAALVIDGGPLSKSAGRAVIATFEAGAR